jgi:orotate phosphoribosyltransferase
MNKRFAYDRVMDASVLDLVGTRQGHFELESGYHADSWSDLETLCLQPRRIRPLAVTLAHRLARYQIDAVCGPLVEGAFVALMVAEEYGCAFTYAGRFTTPHSNALFPVEYRLPSSLQAHVRNKRVAIVTDVISAGSAVRGAVADLRSLGASVVAVGALLVLGERMTEFADANGLALDALAHLPYNLWEPAQCPLCLGGVPLEHPAIA